MKRKPGIVAAIFALAILLRCGQAGAPPLATLELSPIQDPILQGQLIYLVDSSGWRQLAEDGKLSIALVVLDERNQYRQANLNGQKMLYAASLPKIAILFAAMVAAQEGDLEIGPILDKDLHDMIRVSCNPCATRVMARVGREKLLQILQRPEYGFYNEDLYGGLWVGKDYGKRAAHKRDPLWGLSHGATTFQVARLYYRLVTNSLLEPEYTERMLGYLARPGISHKFVAVLQQEEGVRMWRKSGSWQNFHADSVLVESDAGRYILVALVEHWDGEHILRELAGKAHRLVSDLQR